MSLNKIRKRTVQEWIGYADIFLRRAPDPEGRAVLEFLRERSVIAKPVGQTVIALEASRATPFVAIIPYLSDEEIMASREPSFRYSAGAFLPAISSLALMARAPYTSVWKAMVFLHEGHHAYTYLRNPYDYSIPTIYNMKERDTHVYQNRLMALWGGDAYREILERELEWMEGESTRRGQPPGHMGIICQDRVLELDRVFGPSLSALELSARAAHFIIHCNFALIERHCPEHAAQLQANFYGNFVQMAKQQRH